MIPPAITACQVRRGAWVLRRTLLSRPAGGVMMRADLNPRGLTMPATLADRLADFALSTRFEDLPGPVVTEAKRRLIDAFGCAAGALDEPAPGIARRAASKVRGEPGAALIGGGRSS